MLAKERKNEIVSKFAKHDKDTGSCEVQIGIITERIKQISEHLINFPKDNHSRYGLVKLVGKRRTFVSYLKRTDFSSYEKISALISRKKRI